MTTTTFKPNQEQDVEMASNGEDNFEMTKSRTRC
jgi:hypothetical protein